MGVGAGLYMYVVVVQKFTFAISSPDEFLFQYGSRRPSWISVRLGHSFCGLCCYAKFGWNRCSSFDNIKVVTFCQFGLRMPIHAPIRGRLDGLTPVNGNQCQRDHRKADTCEQRRRVTYKSSKAVHWCELCAWRRDQKRKDKERSLTREVHLF